MARTLGSKNLLTLDTIQKYDEYVKAHGDPMEFLFKSMKNRRVPRRDRLWCASQLLPYREVKRVAEKLEDVQGELNLVWDADNPDLQANE